VDNNGSGSGFANRHSWKFSTDNGATAYLFKNDDFFDVSMDLTLTGTVTPRKEAGFLLTTENGGEGQFIVNTDKHEVVAFGGPFPFFAFDSTFDSGETIHLGMTYFRDTDGKRKIIYHAGDQSSSALEFTNNEQGIEIGKTTLGGYLQVQIANDPNNFATANFDNIRISVPAPSALPVFALGSAWGLSLLLRRHKKEKTQKENGSA
jgi:hypothetical protein